MLSFCWQRQLESRSVGHWPFSLHCCVLCPWLTWLLGDLRLPLCCVPMPQPPVTLGKSHGQAAQSSRASRFLPQPDVLTPQLYLGKPRQGCNKNSWCPQQPRGDFAGVNSGKQDFGNVRNPSLKSLEELRGRHKGHQCHHSAWDYHPSHPLPAV